jgi:hypothetical protein
MSLVWLWLSITSEICKFIILKTRKTYSAELFARTPGIGKYNIHTGCRIVLRDIAFYISVPQPFTLCDPIFNHNFDRIYPSPLKSRLFTALCKIMNAVPSASLFSCKARWFSRGIFVKCIYAFRDEIAIFLEKENGPEAEKFLDDFCVMKLSYLVDIFEKLNILKNQLQGANIHLI